MRRTSLLLLIGLSFGCALTVPVFAQPSSVAPSPARDPLGELVAEAAQRFALPAAWIRAVMRAESNGDPRAISPKGAMGLMQIMPETWAGLRDRYRLGADPYDPHDNIVAGAAYIRELYDRYGSPGWIAAYNAGPGRYEDSLKGRSLPAETRAYVANVAPSLGEGDAPAPVLIAAADPLAWTQAPLFVAQSERRTAPVPLPVERTSNDAGTTPGVRDVSAIVPQSGGLFVARAGDGTAR
jgi:hypothetical protein